MRLAYVGLLSPDLDRTCLIECSAFLYMALSLSLVLLTWIAEPQGSCLGPLLYAPKLFKIGHYLPDAQCFADNTQLMLYKLWKNVLTL